MRNKTILKRLAAAQRRYEEASKAFHCLMPLAYPVGSHVVWNRGLGSPHSGTVVAWGYSDRLRVFNQRTGNKRWITFDQIDY